ncbi:hypothetical protein [Rhodopirellula sp. SWK7]|uniref:hypothetical protein n=1 Tax=Rhodopirellula sp. SWK7 TaxID=595460 RepID=UPI0002BFA25C|nr:hypothetical protein [Rhodopirellula sp. SWK7]EMI40297.1 putative secreted protein [Rhodopirellula sp. SWK7]
MRHVARFRKHMLTLIAGSTIMVGSPTLLQGEDTPGYYTDPSTGIVYRKVVRTIERPVVETKIAQRQETVYKPKTVVETRPTTRRTYTPVTEFRWVPRVEGRWNPFRQPTVAYHHVPETRWQSRDEVIAETKTQVQWEAVTQTVDVPQRLTRIAREEQVDFEPVGRVAPPAARTLASNVAPEIAARLRPLDTSAPVQPLGTSGATPTSSSFVTRDDNRSSLQTGLRATELAPDAARGYTQPLGIGNTTGVAGLSVPRIWR